MKPLKIKTTELQIGDVVRTYDGPWSTSIVKQIKEGRVTLYRPYGHAADFLTSGGVICYLGVEEFTLFPSSTEEVELLERTHKRWVPGGLHSRKGVLSAVLPKSKYLKGVDHAAKSLCLVFHRGGCRLLCRPIDSLPRTDALLLIACLWLVYEQQRCLALCAPARERFAVCIRMPTL